VGNSSNYGFTSSGLTGSSGGGMLLPIYDIVSLRIDNPPKKRAEAEIEARY
jgi:hypothetical protein